MKALKTTSLVLFISIVLFSCDKEPHEDIELPGTFLANVDGETIDFSYKPRATIGLANDIDALFLTGVTTDFTKEIDITVVNLFDVGSYPLGGASDNDAYVSSSPLGGGLLTTYGSTVGEVTVTSYKGNNIKGSFHFDAVSGYNAEDIITITGTFDVKVYE